MPDINIAGVSSAKRLKVLYGFSDNMDARTCVDEIHSQVDMPGLSSLIFFCSSLMDLEQLGLEIKGRFNCPIMGCTTSGEISGHGYTSGSMVAVGFSSDRLRLHDYIINPLDGFSMEDANKLSLQIARNLTFSQRLDPALNFGLLLVDGMSMKEEQLVANLHRSMDGVNLIGGSAGDDLQFQHTYVYHNGKFIGNAAMLGIFETTLPFRTFKMQHFQPTDKRLVITKCDPSTRTVTEINGGPAAVEYASAVGLKIEELTPMIFAAYPVMLRIGGEYYIRSIQKVNDDQSLTFYCAIDNGLVLRVAEGVDFVPTLRKQMQDLKDSLPELKMVLGCDCILRRLEILEKDIQDEVSSILKSYGFIGFSTYGEQFNSVHVNQTLTGVAIGDDVHD